MGYSRYYSSGGYKSAPRVKQPTPATLLAATAWLEANVAEGQWLLEASNSGFEFATSVLQALKSYGSLTERQEQAVRNATVRSAERKAQAVQREVNAVDIDISAIDNAFDAARASGLKKPRLNITGYAFSPAPVTGKNPGAIYVKEGEAYLGKIVAGKFIRSRDCNDDQETSVLAIAADPHAAAATSGRLTGSCSCCGRELSDPESVALGIGPICRDRFGWQ